MSIEDLSTSFLGIIGLPQPVPLLHFLDRGFHVMQCRTGNIARNFNYVRSWSGREVWDFNLCGAASETSPELVKLKAIAEAAERYASSVILPGEYRIACADELGDEVFDWRGLPRLSEEEKSLPAQWLHDFDPAAPMRWISALDVRGQRVVHVPVVLSHLYPRAWTSERFWLPISTGVAVHTDIYKAMTGAILEVIERDALAVNWLLQRPLRRLRFDAAVLERLGPVIAQMVQAPDIRLYEATTDLGIPIVYARRFRPSHEKVANVVACACDFSPLNAVRKAISELVMISNALEQTDHRPPADKLYCETLLDGATYMMRPEMAGAFGFLDAGGELDLREWAGPDLPAEDSEARFDALAATVAAAGKNLYLAELTCDELEDVGLRAFRAILPELMPMSFMHRARFLGSARLEEFQRWLGRDGDIRNFLNPDPQPFA